MSAENTEVSSGKPKKMETFRFTTKIENTTRLVAVHRNDFDKYDEFILKGLC